MVIGLSSMLGAGVFVAFAPAAAAAGAGLLVGLVVAAVVAWTNATATAQLAAVHPVAGGAYTYGRLRLGPAWGFVAGWSFVVGKTASCAVMATAAAAYLVPPAWQRPVAAAVVAVLVGVNLRGITRTARVARVLLLLVLASLTVLVGVVGAGLGGLGGPRTDATAAAWLPFEGLLDAGPAAILQSAALLFFAFAGYARVATLGEEVREPARTLPRAITVALAVAVAVYGVVGLTVLLALGPDGVADSPVPLADAAARFAPWADPVVRVGAVAASGGALLALLAGIGRTALAMAREGDLPRGLAVVGPRAVPHRAELVVGAVVVVLVLTVDLTGMLAASSVGVLLYYGVANAAAFTQTGAERRSPRALQVVGVLACLALVASLPVQAVVTALVVVGVGLVGFAVARRRAPGRRAR